LKKSISLTKALTLSIGNLKQPVITEYQAGVIFFDLCLSGKYEGQRIDLPENAPDVKIFQDKLAELLETGVLTKFQRFGNVFGIIGKNIYSEEEIACTIDPFAFVSHLSAMSYHGLTDRMPKIIFLSSPPQKEWRQFALKKMEKDLGDRLEEYHQKKMPPLTRIRFEKIQKKPVEIYSSIHLGAFKSVRERMLRVATIGRTFLDMMRKPDLCGGIYHVIDVYKEHAATYLKLIIDEFDQHGKDIDKVRAGYILETLCGLSDPGIMKWQKFAVRGGSRKLDPAAEYSSTYSEKWCLSINVEVDANG
jgi:predicted transcriptional regulator of viral defense system